MAAPSSEEGLNAQQMALLGAAEELEVRHEPAPIERLAQIAGIDLDATEQLVAALDLDDYLQHGVTTATASAQDGRQPAMIVAYRLTDLGRRVLRGYEH